MKRVRGQVAEILALDSVKNENENVSNHDHHVPLPLLQPLKPLRQQVLVKVVQVFTKYVLVVKKVKKKKRRKNKE
jgi:hypothetical protein